MTITLEEAEIILDQIADALPSAIFNGLNGGYVLTAETKIDKNGLYILGHYNVEPNGLGRYITVYYGSIAAVYGNMNEHGWRRQLKDVLHHELTHHLEHLAGDRSLEIQDEVDKARYLS
ncbi:MAG: metallopeptidase family protein [Defluviitaleaceae bacterium]|nr:metallopeptidase family protein [Defluviitaleaceae bacterium]